MANKRISLSLQRVERDFRQIKTGLLEVRPVFVRKESRTRGHLFCCMLALKISREMERRLQATFGTTDANPHAITPADAMPGGKVILLEYVYSRNPLRRVWMRLLAPLVERLFGARFDRRTREHMVRAGFQMVEEDFVSHDIILKLVGRA